jgi:hypothetical protein
LIWGQIPDVGRRNRNVRIFRSNVGPGQNCVTAVIGDDCVRCWRAPPPIWPVVRDAQKRLARTCASGTSCRRPRVVTGRALPLPVPSAIEAPGGAASRPSAPVDCQGRWHQPSPARTPTVPPSTRPAAPGMRSPPSACEAPPAAWNRSAFQVGRHEKL